MLDNYIKWFKAHEKVLALILVVAMIVFLGNKYLNSSYDAAVAREKSAEQVLQVQKEANDKLAIQNQQAQAQYQVLLGQLNSQNQRLSAEMLTLSQTLAARQKQDVSLPLPELATRWQDLLSLPANSITSTENGLQVSPEGARATVTSLESLPVLQKQLSDETIIADNKSKELDSSTTLVVGLNQQITGLNLQLSDSSKACKTEVAVARKSRWKWFKVGVVTGFVAGVVTGHYIP